MYVIISYWIHIAYNEEGLSVLQPHGFIHHTPGNISHNLGTSTMLETSCCWEQDRAKSWWVRVNPPGSVHRLAPLEPPKGAGGSGQQAAQRIREISRHNLAFVAIIFVVFFGTVTWWKKSPFGFEFRLEWWFSKSDSGTSAHPWWHFHWSAMKTWYGVHLFCLGEDLFFSL